MMFSSVSVTDDPFSSESSSKFASSDIFVGIFLSHYDPRTLEHVVNHVFFTPHRPDFESDFYIDQNRHTLARAVLAAARAYNEYIDDVDKPHWLHIAKMLEDLQVILQLTEKSYEDSQLDGIKAGDVRIFSTETVGFIIRKQDRSTLYERFRHSGSSEAETKEVVDSYLELVFEISDDQVLDGERLRYKHPHSVWGKLTYVGHQVEPKRITKYVGLTCTDKGSRSYGRLRWSRSPIWFLIRVAIQSSLDRSPLGHSAYKPFILFFLCSLANYATHVNLSSVLLHSMSAKILRRFRKHGSSIPQWLSDIVSHTCTSLSRILDRRWQEVQAPERSSVSSLPWDPSQLDLTKDIQHFLPLIHEYISTSFSNHCGDPLPTPFLPNSSLRGSLGDFLSNPDNFLSRPNESSHHDDIHVVFCDVERAVGEDIDDWVACVTNIGKACQQLEHLVHQYQSFALDRCRHEKDTCNPDHLSTTLLTIIEIWVALDKLAVKEIPILADYSPEVPLALLSRLLLRGVVNIHRLCRAYQYLFARYTQAHPGWSVLSNEFTKHSFPCRYYDCSPHLQHLKNRIEDTLPVDPLYAKVVVFELQCPVSFDMWRSVTCKISNSGMVMKQDEKDKRVHDIPELQPHFRHDCGHSLSLYSSPSAPKRWDRLYYVYERFRLGHLRLAYQLASGPYANSRLQRYIDDTTHTSNEVLAAQANCDPNLSLHEFIAFAHLRSGGSLQWHNILRELRSRTLEFRHQEVYLLFAQASAQVGPLDSTGELLWHQELQDPSFCLALLGELESLFINVGVGSMDGPAMATISLLVGVLALNFSGDVAEPAIKLLRDVRRKTFDWVRELVYNVRRSPTNQESLQLLRDMAAVCRSTFNVGAAARHELLRSPQDIEIALSCAMLIRTTILSASSDVSAFTQVLLDCDCDLSLFLEGNLRDAIQADTTDLGVDRAVQMVWPCYRPSPRQWEPLQSPNSRWLVCETAPTRDRRSQTVHVNLLDGSLLVDGQPIGNQLPSIVTSDSTYCQLFGDLALVVVASDLLGMDFVTTSAIHKHLIHFAVREDNSLWSCKCERVTIRAQSIDTDDVFELIPPENLSWDLPRSLIEGHVHWWNLSTSIIEIRPIEKPWKQSSDNWTIDLRQSRVTKGGEFLVDKRSPTWEMVSSRFRCLDEPANLLITMSLVDTTRSSSSPQLFVTLLRYGLSFFVNEDDTLESRDFKGMVYDEDQCIGTLFGLANRLVLCSKPQIQIEADLIPKIVIIPHGHDLDEHFPLRLDNCLYEHGHKVSVRLPPSGPVEHYTYQVDSELGCLTGIVSLESRLYLADLHARTGSGYRPDPLTGRTGVEEAISLIWLAGTRQGTSKWCSKSQSPQIRFASAKIQDYTDRKREERELTGNRQDFCNEYALLQEAHLFQSEIAASLQLPKERPSESLEQLLHERPAMNLPARNRLPHYNPRRPDLSSPNADPMRQLFSSLRTNKSAPPFQSEYLSRLHYSAHCSQRTDSIGVVGRHDSGKLSTKTLREHYVKCRTSYATSLDMVKMALSPQTPFERILDQCGQWPRITPFTLFRCLASTSPIKAPESWKKCLISLALLALDLQQARRLLRFALDDLEEEFCRELENEGCDGWNPAEYPDWLLIQLQGNFVIRRVQADVAKEMMSPRSGKNTVMQVNMGEGKTSVIIPICAAALADGNQLVRIVVPKALIPQVLQLLTDRLCGLVNKPIYHLTFSRDDINVVLDSPLTRRDREEPVIKVKLLHKLVAQCRDERGIIVTQPEHILSLKLACVETQLLENRSWTSFTPIAQKRGFEHVLHVLTGSSLVKNTFVPTVIAGVKRWYHRPGIDRSWMQYTSRKAKIRSQQALLELQRLLETHARDILDESDDVLRPQLQLIYATGHQQPFEGSPDRWVIIQQVLGLVKRHAYFLSTPDSLTIRCDHSSIGSFPHIHILQAERGEELISLIAQDVSDGRLSSLSFRSELLLKGAVREFILRKDVHPDVVKMVEKYAHQSTSWGPLLLLRGLFAYDVLLFALTQRRWRVDYGLDPTSPPRTMLAIPYRAKDVPAETAEFGHPDMTILLTCLSYYYGGLSENQLRISFELLLQQDDPSSEYALWLQDCDTVSVPNALRQLSEVNIRSLEQWDEYVVPLFTRNKRAIDLYLSKVVFAKYAKEFPRRVSGSYWDIAELKHHLVTGFSGTNDGQYLLPTSIVQNDPDHLHQTGTNARILAYLLQHENSSYMVMTDENGERWNTLKLLRMVVAQEPKVRVLLDVGAQVLDLSNFEMAKAWLDCTPATETAGAVYFSSYDELMVLERTGTTQPLSSSPLARQLHRCVTYLDDAHTRGTDLKFPLGFRAAVTLGHKVTKDHLVQGCMRMRKLGHGHSVMFFAPHEVDQRIRGLVAKENQSVPVTTADVLKSAIHQTWSDIRRHAPYWAQQGMSHQSRLEVWSGFCQNKATSKQLADAWVQPELKSLADMYMPCHYPDTISSTKLPRQILERCENLGVLSLPDLRMDEEQEREVSREIERERQVERPPEASPAAHFLHPDVIQFVRTGVVPSPSRSEAFRHVFATSTNNSPATPSELHAWSSCILATADFCETITESDSVQGRVNDYLRPVQWVLSGKMSGRDAIVLLSPFEADLLMPDIRISEHVHLHLYIPRTTKRMKPSDNLRLYSVPPVPSDWIPPWTLIDQLNVFAGQVYLSDYTSYVRLCRFLGVHTEELPQKAGVVARNWFSDPGSFDAEIKNRFEGTPLLLAILLLALRRGMDFAGTHMGKILEGLPLNEEDFKSSAP